MYLRDNNIFLASVTNVGMFFSVFGPEIPGQNCSSHIESFTWSIMLGLNLE